MEDDEEVLIDWRTVGIPKKGEKEFEPDGSTTQEDSLGSALAAMWRALGLPRGHSAKNHVEAVWIGEGSVVPSPKGNYFKDMGHSVRGVLHLSKLETVYLCERGSMTVLKADDEFMELLERATVDEMRKLDLSHLWSVDLAWLYANASLDLDEYQVFGHLKRLGYHVMPYSLQWAPKRESRPEPARPWWQPRYTTYYNLFYWFSRSKTVEICSDPPKTEKSPGFAVWRPTNNFSKRDPPHPHYRVLAASANDPFPTLSEINTLISESPGNAPALVSHKKRPPRQPKNPTAIYNKTRDQKFRMGKCPTVLAVNSFGVINFVTLAEGDFELVGDSELDGLNPYREIHGIVSN
ncbi:hypothetical protein DICA2_C02542 [Diutina catenulata]